MIIRANLIGAVAVTLLGTLVACGGASMDFVVQSPPWRPFPSPGPVDLYGKLENSGAVALIGLRLDATVADVRVNGRSATVTDLRAGQVVHVIGTVNADRVTGSASSVDAEAALVGPVWSVSAADATLVALGQPVRTDVHTLWDARLGPGGATSLHPGTHIEVHGWRNEAGEIVATRVALDDAGGEVQVVGRTASLDAAAATFVIGGLDVRYGAASVLDVGGGLSAEDVPVVVRGTLVGDTLVAREVRSVPLQLVQVYHLLP